MSTAQVVVRLGTRGSPAAVHQAKQVAEALRARSPEVATELVMISTSGDRWQGDLARLGGKGAFVREIDRALLDGGIDVAVHCLKDIPGDQPPPAGVVSRHICRGRTSTTVWSPRTATSWLTSHRMR